MVWKPKSPAIIHAPAEALDKYGNPRIGGGLPSSRRMMMAAAGAGGAYACDAVVFDGTNDWLTRGADLTGNANGKTGIFSAWLNLNGGNATELGLYVSANAWMAIRRRATNKIEIRCHDVGGTADLIITSSTTYTDASGWMHVLASWDLANTSGWLYVNDADDLAGGATLTDDTLDYTRSDHGIGAHTTGVYYKLDADMADLYIHFGTSLDLSVAANRRKFIDGDGKPVDLGSDGSTPTSSQPIIFQHIDVGEAAANFGLNAGSGGDFTVNGTLATAASSPSD